jgi:muramoyltetrapeptide carboxypeptidase
VAIVAPGASFERSDLEAGLKVLAERYTPVFDDSIFSRWRYLAGTDERRLRELVAALSNDQIRAVFCVRGGYGMMRLLRQLDWRNIGAKPLIGFSDVTALHLSMQAQGRASIHGPMVAQLAKQSRPAIDRLFGLLESSGPPPSFTGATPLVPGVAEGPLIGGNLSVLTRLLGTPFLPRLHGAVLLLEDVGERPYRLDRMWTHLALAGVFEQVAGIALGVFSLCEESDADYDSADVLRSLAEDTGLPCAIGFPVGHCDSNFSVPLGGRVRLDAARGQLDFLEPAVEASQNRA